MSQFKIVQTGAPVGAALADEREGLAEFAGDLISYGSLNTPEKLIDACRDADACLVPVRYGVGYDTIDGDAASQHNILVVNIPDFCMPEVANHALALLLDCAKKISRLDRWMRTGGWQGGRAPFLSPMGPIHGETVGLVGFGQIARTFHRRVAALDMKVLAYDPFVSQELAASLNVELVSLEELLRRSDYVSIHVPLMAATKGLINAEKLALMKPSAYLINTSRGPVVDETALIAALQDGQIAGAGLDVFEHEPLSNDSPLLRMENVTVTPHTASYADETFRIMFRRVGEEAALTLRGQMPNTPVNGTIKPNLTWLKAR